MLDWARTLVRNLEECRRGHEESKVQIEFLMAQLLELKTEKTAEAPCPAASVTAEPCFNQPLTVQAEEPQWDAAKRGAKLEVTVFDGSLDPKKYMD